MKLLREPLVHFLLLGGALFGIFALAGRWTEQRPDRIVITPGLIENLQLGFARSARRDPTPQELDAVIEDYVREEVLNREAVARGLDRDDPVVRRRLRERMEFLTEDDAEAAAPTDAQLNDFLQQHPESFRRQGNVPPLAEIRDAVQRAWEAARRKEANDAAYQKMRARYSIVIERPAPGAVPAPAAKEAK
ncbi:MAG TPA: hypothetical protein VG838_00890 [Opitutaceae bacterium]|nr:hypothetical protein [Opitutaceae bacterium]